MHPNTAIQIAKKGYIVTSLVLCGIGLWMLLSPALSLSLLGSIVGAALIVSGIVKLGGYLSRDLYQLAFQFDLAFGILMMALGFIILVRPEHTMSLLCIILGTAVLADGLFKIQTSIDARRFGLKTWWLILPLAILTSAAGMTMMLCPSQSARVLVTIMGISLLAEGMLSLCVALCTVKVLQKPSDHAGLKP